MIIPVNLPSSSNSENETTFPPQLAKLGTKEVILLELQGSVQTEGDRDGQLVGTLKIDEKTEKPTMIIGHHMLEGKIVNLSKPLAVLKKRSTNKTPPLDIVDSEDMDVDGESRPEDASTAPEYDIVAVVKRKVLFSKRPMPITAASSVPLRAGDERLAK